jgi:glycosyltransferase involved in cell wall biosynthesis
MKIVSTSYVKTVEFNDPLRWLQRISFYTGLLEALASNNEVISFERINYEGVLEKNNVRYHFIKQAGLVERFPSRAHRLIRSMKPDLVVVHGATFPLQVMQLRRAIGKNSKIIVIHQAEKPATGFRKYLQRMADKSVDAYLFASKEFGNEWKKNIDVSKIREAWVASSDLLVDDKQRCRKELDIKEEKIYLWVGRLEKNKDPITVVRAFMTFLEEERMAALYMIFQSGELVEQVKELVSDNARIHLVGAIAHDDLSKWFSSSDFYVSGSHYEGAGTAVVEAISCGCIPILTDIISFRKFLRNGTPGFLYEAGNEMELLKVLRRSVSIAVSTERQKVLSHFSQEFSFPAIAGRIEQIARSI